MWRMQGFGVSSSVTTFLNTMLIQSLDTARESVRLKSGLRTKRIANAHRRSSRHEMQLPKRQTVRTQALKHQYRSQRREMGNSGLELVVGVFCRAFFVLYPSLACPSRAHNLDKAKSLIPPSNCTALTSFLIRPELNSVILTVNSLS
jgi:hypothetical protein